MTASALSPERPAIHPDRLRAALDPRLSDATVARLLACDRLRERLVAPLGGGAAPEPGFAWLLVDPEAVARHLGSALHGPALRRVLEGPAVAALAAAIGRDAYLFGLRHGAACPPRDAGGDLAGAIRRDGHAGLGAWLAGAPDGVRRAVRLALPPGTPAEAVDHEPALAETVAPLMALLAEAAGDESEDPAHV